MRVIKALGAAIVMAALLAGPPWALVRFIGNPWPEEGVSLSAPLTDGAIIGLLAAVVWVLWAQLVACIVVEAVAALTDDRIQLRVPFTLGGPATLRPSTDHGPGVGRRVHPGAPAAAAAASAPEKATPATSLSLAAVHHQPGQQTGRDAGETADADGGTCRRWAETPHGHGDASGLVVVDRGAGSGRWRQVAGDRRPQRGPDDERRHQVHLGRPHQARLGAAGATRCSGRPRPPGRRARGREHQVIVEEGDTLSQIALEELGDADAYPQIFEASKDIAQPGGRHLVDPDVIDVGWTVQIPGQDAPVDHEPDRAPTRCSDARRTAHRPAARRSHGADGGHPDVTGDRSPEHSGRTSGRRRSAGHLRHGRPGRAERGRDGGITALRALLASRCAFRWGRWGWWRPTGVASSGAAGSGGRSPRLPTSSWRWSRRSSRTARRLRRTSSSSTGRCGTWPRRCKVAGSPLPQLGAAVLGDEDLTLLFTHPAAGEVPEGWTATDDARAWMLPRWTFLEQDLETQPAPYPALVSVGQDEGGRTWLLDLETLGVCGIGGEPQQVADLARFMVAELAVNAWSEGSEVLLADQFGAETIGLNPARLRQVERSDALARAAVLTGEMGEVEQNLDADVLTRRRDGLLLDTTNPVVVVVASRPEGEFVADIEDRDRSRVVVVHGDEESPAVELAGDGMAFLPMWGISVKAFTLPTSEAEAMAALLASTRNLEDEPVPATRVRRRAAGQVRPGRRVAARGVHRAAAHRGQRPVLAAARCRRGLPGHRGDDRGGPRRGRPECPGGDPRGDRGARPDAGPGRRGLVRRVLAAAQGAPAGTGRGDRPQRRRPHGDRQPGGHDLLHRLPGLSGPRRDRGAGRRGLRVEDPEDGSEPRHQRPLPAGHPTRRQRLAARREHERRGPPGHQPDLRARPGQRRGAQQRRPVRAAAGSGPRSEATTAARRTW